MMRRIFAIGAIAIVGWLSASVMAATVQITEYFNSDPGWVGLTNTENGNNYGYISSSNKATTDTLTTANGEIGGIVARNQGYYADDIGNVDPSNTVLRATGKWFSPDYQGGCCYVGWFNSTTFEGSIFSGFPKDTIGFYTEGFGGINAGGVLNPTVGGSAGTPFSHDSGADRPEWGMGCNSYQFSFEMVFDPNGGAQGYGTLTLTMFKDGAQYGNPGVVNLLEGEKDNILNLDRFGIWSRNYGQSTNVQEIYFDYLCYTAEETSSQPEPYYERFEADRHWEALGNAANGNDFGYKATNLAGGATAGELGGTLACTAGSYGMDIGTLDPSDTVLRASGKFFSPDFQGGQAYIGWYNSASLVKVPAWAPNPNDAIGFYTEGFGGTNAAAVLNAVVSGSYGETPYTLESRPEYGLACNTYQFSFLMVYDPNGGNEGNGTLTLTIYKDGAQYGGAGVINLAAGDKDKIRDLDRFGIWCRNKSASTTVQEIYFDDLIFTADYLTVPVELSEFTVE